MNIKDSFNLLLNSFLDGSLERLRIIQAMNECFREYFFSGDINRLCKVSIAPGDSDFAHEMSSFSFRSGFKISIENDNNLREREITEISQYILNNKSFIRQLMSMGFDTLIVQGEISKIGKKFNLKGYANLDDYFIGK